ncbi:hypothetical protein GOP47_0012543 [Adiantum capillus-veneris]|uniref:Uncharacterized protein n=1 Tax=Adiantum capillus-veneris TaxID=13818 RepID=A0A9D4URD8_ADICA|nr:hypothetical protein GOP47_0012543 [Adiantum capillus-veneris]
MKSSSRRFSSSPSSLSRWEAVELGHGGLSLVPRLRVLLSFVRADLSVRPLDEWQLRQSLLGFLRDSLSITVSDKDLSLHKHKNPHKRRSDEALASGVLYIWDIQALLGESRSHKEDAAITLQKKERMLIEKLTGVELNLGGLKLRCHARPEDRDDFFSLKRSWHESDEGQEKGLPNTMVLRGIPSRWLAELRVSSKASVLVTHTVFSQFGSIRNLDIQINDSESFSCNVWVQFEHYSEFYNAMVAFCGRSMVKEGSNFKANYEVNWDNDGYFTEGNIRKRKFEKQRLEDLRRRQAFMETRQADIARRQTELARFEQERREAERIQRLREEENWRREREAAAAEQEMFRQKELERLKEEERVRKEKHLREQIQREEEQKALEVKRREEEFRKLEEQLKEKHRADMRDRETWTVRSPRYCSPEVVNRSYLDSRRQLGKTGREVEKLPETYPHGSGNGQHDDSNDRERVSRLAQGRSVTEPSHATVEDPKDDDLQRWVLDTGPSLFSKYTSFKVGSSFASHTKRLKSIIVDSKQSL